MHLRLYREMMATPPPSRCRFVEVYPSACTACKAGGNGLKVFVQVSVRQRTSRLSKSKMSLVSGLVPRTLNVAVLIIFDPFGPSAFFRLWSDSVFLRFGPVNVFHFVARWRLVSRLVGCHFPRSFRCRPLLRCRFVSCICFWELFE